MSMAHINPVGFSLKCILWNSHSLLNHSPLQDCDPFQFGVTHPVFEETMNRFPELVFITLLPAV